MRRSGAFWVAAVVCCAVAGCAALQTQESALIEYRRSGGITGREDRLVVRADGTAELSRRGTAVDFTVGEDTLARLRSMVQRIAFDSLRDEYLPPRPGADLYEYVLVYGNRRIRTMDTAVPPELQPLIQVLSGLANRR